MTELYIGEPLLEELSRALQVDGVGLDPGFLPNLRYINARRNLFTSFIDSGQVVGRSVQFSQQYTSRSTQAEGIMYPLTMTHSRMTSSQFEGARRTSPIEVATGA